MLCRSVVMTAAAACMFLGTAAHAVTFKFTGVNRPDAPSRSFTVNDLELTVTAGTFSSVSNPSTIDFSTRKVDQDPDGLGVDGGFFESDQIDGKFGNDVLVFSFDQDVIIESVKFGNVDNNDRFAFGTVVNGAFDRIVSFQDIRNPFDLSTIATDEQRTGSAFGFGAIGKKDNFTIKKLVVSLAPPQNNPPAVPLPASGALLLGGLGVAAIAGRRRRKTQKAYRD